MSKTKKGVYLTPSLGNVYFQDDIVIRPSQGGGIVGGGDSGDDFSTPPVNNPAGPMDEPVNVVPDVANEQITDVITVPEADGTVTE